MKLADQWRSIHASLPDGWSDARLELTPSKPENLSRAAALLGPAGPGRLGGSLRLTVARAGGAIGPDNAAKLLGKLDAEGVRGTLSLLDAAERVQAAPAAPAIRGSAAGAWRTALAGLPADWSDLYCELELSSTDHLDRAALLVAPVNPARVSGRSAFRYRVAHSFGYGASPQMTERCLERLDDEEIPARLTILHVLSDTHNVATQGPVWRVGGKAV
jgi:hypothetical protein